MLYTMNKFEYHLYKTLLGNDQRMQLFDKIASFLEDGVDLHRVLTKLGEKYAENGDTDPRSKVLLEWAAGMNEGVPFSACISQWVPASESMLIRAGEEAGEIAESIRNAMFATQSVKEMKGKLTSELSYPVALMLALVGMLYMISTVVMPELAQVQNPEMWPSSSKSLYSLTEFVRDSWYLLIIGVVGFGYGLGHMMPRLTGPIRAALDNVIPFSTYRSVQSSIFMISVASQMKTGVPIVDAVETMEKMSNRYISWHLNKILLKLNSGVIVGKALNSGFMDRETGVDIEVLGETSNLQDAMVKIGSRAIENTMESITKMASILRVISLLMLTIFIGWTFSSIQSITQGIAAAAVG